MPATDYEHLIADVPGLSDAVGMISQDERPGVRASAIEFVLEGLHLNKRLNKDSLAGQALYRG